ncbi:MAG: lipase family protein [Pseudomonadota bacterium]|nr:lipase family protein [Pseudomonadota bacterium]
MTPRFALSALTAATLTIGLAGCGGSSNNDHTPPDDGAPARGALLAGPTTTALFASAADLQSALAATAAGRQLMALGGAPRCGVRLAHVAYATVGGRAEPTNASAAVMVPQGADPACSGARPVLLYAHGTTFDRAYNMASPANGEAGLLTALYASQGYLVVAPNYAGYDVSTLGYHPYLNAEQQSADMVDALRAARQSYAQLGTSESGAVLVSGYSQGGHVAMATARAMQQADLSGEFRLLAAGPMSGPYALSSMLRTVFAGGVNLGATGFTPLLMTSWQHAYGNLYATPAEAYEDAYAATVPTLLPGTTPFGTLLATGQLPPYLFSGGALEAGTPMDAVFAAGVGSPFLIRDSYRHAAMTQPAHPLWAAAERNDLRNFTPARPMALCYGAADPVVFGANTLEAESYFHAQGAQALITRMDVEDPTTVGTPLANAFAQAKQAVASDPDAAGNSPEEKVLLAYHGGLVPAFCGVAVRGFFDTVLAASPR